MPTTYFRVGGSLVPVAYDERNGKGGDSDVIAVPPPASGADFGPAIQAAIDSLNGAGGVWLPSGTYNVDTPISMRKPGGGTCSIYFVLEGNTVLNARNLPATFTFNGTTYPVPLLRSERNNASEILVGGGSLSVANPGKTAAAGTAAGVGFWIAPADPTNPSNPPNYLFGTMSAGCHIEHLSVSGFDVGIRVGWKSFVTPPIQIAASEWTFNSVKVSNCNIGVLLEDFNTLDNNFLDLSMSANKVGVQCINGGGETRIVGGSSSQQGCDFQFASGGQFSLRNFRSENVGSTDGVTLWPNFFGRGSHVVVSSGVAQVLIDSCLFSRPIPTGVASIIGTHNAHVIVNACHLSALVWHSTDVLPIKTAGKLTVTDSYFNLLSASDLDGSGNVKPMFKFASGAPASAYDHPSLVPGGCNIQAFCSRNRATLDNGTDAKNVTDVVYP